MNQQNTAIEIDQESSIKGQLGAIDLIIKSGNKNHALAVAQTIAGIHDGLNENSEISIPLQRRVKYVYSKIMEIIGGMSDEIEGIFLEIGNEIKILSTMGGVVVFKGKESHIIICEKDEKKVIDLIIQTKSGLEIKSGKEKQVQRLVKSLNTKFNQAGVYFGIQDGVLLCGEKNMDNNVNLRTGFTKEREESHINHSEIPSKNIDTQKPIHTNVLYFGENKQKSVRVDIYCPIKIGRKTEALVRIGDEYRRFKYYVLELFLELINNSSSQGIESSQRANISLFNSLKNTKIELVGRRTGLQLAWREDSNTKITLFSGVRQPVVKLREVWNKDTTKIDRLGIQGNKQVTKIPVKPQDNQLIQDRENIVGVINKTEFQSVRALGEGRFRKVIINFDGREVALSPRQLELFIKFYKSNILSISLSPAEYQIYLKLKEILPELINYFESKRLRLKRKKSKNKKRVKQESVGAKNNLNIENPQLNIKDPQEKSRNLQPRNKASLEKDTRWVSGITRHSPEIQQVITETKEVYPLSLEEKNPGFESKIYNIFYNNPGVFFQIEELTSRIGDNSEDFYTKFLLAKSYFNRVNGEKIFERKGKGWFMLPDINQIENKTKIEFTGVYSTDFCYYVEEFGVLLDSEGGVIFQSGELESFIIIKNRKIYPKSGKNLRRNIETLRTKLRNKFPGIKVSAGNIGYPKI